MKPSHRFYKVCYRIARIILGIFYYFDVQGKENIPEGAALLCANHSSILDPFFVAFACGAKRHIHIMAKAELYKVPVISAIIRKLGTIRVDRKTSDIHSVKETLNYLKKGEKVAVFPEGTRKPVENAVTAKNGAVKIAKQAKVNIVPMYIPRKKRPFSKITIIIGEPYTIGRQDAKNAQDGYTQLTGELMNKIESMKPADKLNKRSR